MYIYLHIYLEYIQRVANFVHLPTHHGRKHDPGIPPPKGQPIQV